MYQVVMGSRACRRQPVQSGAVLLIVPYDGVTVRVLLSLLDDLVKLDNFSDGIVAFEVMLAR